MNEETNELLAKIAILEKRAKWAEDRAVEHEKLKRTAISQKIKYRNQLEDLITYIVDHAVDNGNIFTSSLQNLKDEFDFFDDISKSLIY